MLTKAELNILLSEEKQAEIERNIECQPTKVALDKSIYHSHLVATQVKYLQRAKSKIPSYYKAMAIIPSLGFEQSSNEAVALAKNIEGESALDLTCGLGVDTFALSKKFKRVVSIERDEVLAQIARENFRRLGASNIEVVNSSAEEYLAGCTERFDWVYIDPDRRSEGKKLVLLQDCSPNILELLPQIESISSRLMIKCSPIFDVDEAFRLFEGCNVEVVSVANECKELLISYFFDNKRESEIFANAISKGRVGLQRTANKAELQHVENPEFLLIPDVALQKARLARSILSEVAQIENDNAYAFATQSTLENYDASRHLARIERIDEICEFDPKRLKKIFAERRVKQANILKKDFPYSTNQILRQLKLREGGTLHLVFTTLSERKIVIFLK